MGVELEKILKRLRWAEVMSPGVLIALMAYLTFGKSCIDPKKLYEVSKPLLEHLDVDWWNFKFHLEWITDDGDCRRLSNHYYEKAKEMLSSVIEEREVIEVVVRR